MDGACDKGFWWANLKEAERLSRPRGIWEYNIKSDLKETGRKGVDYIGTAQDRNKWRDLANRVMQLWVP